MPDVPLPQGLSTVFVKVTDYAGNESEQAQVSFTVDTVSPEIYVDSPVDNSYLNNPATTLVGHVSEYATLTVGGNAVILDEQLGFTVVLALVEGGNSYEIVATDDAGNDSSIEYAVYLDTQAPPQAESSLSSATETVDGWVKITGDSGSVEPGSVVSITNTLKGQVDTTTASSDGSFSLNISANPGDLVEISVIDQAGNAGVPFTLQIASGGSDDTPPPNPATIAPSLLPSEMATMHEAVSFLYMGSNRIQTGVSAEAIEPRRVAVIRGRVLNRDNEPLSGVKITIKDHPEFGQTLSRADGMFDMVVNGGGYLAVKYEKAGVLSAQRKVEVPWRDFTFAEDVVLVELDEVVTVINTNDSSEPFQVARGSVSSDADGERQATILFPQGVSATMTLSDGTVQAVSTLNVRATEYTVGENGPLAMPGPLPPTSGYTYAVELSVDEAQSVGAKNVEFSQPLPFYVDNFLNFPVGETVPVGWYDYEHCGWVPSDSGRIIRIVAIANGVAELDVDGDALVDGADKLSVLGISESEQIQLAALYPEGKSLWRVRVSHFTPWDLNWGVEPPKDAGSQEDSTDEKPETKDEKDEEKPECESGCMVFPENQVLGEVHRLKGTKHAIHYRSNRVSGRKSRNIIDIPLSGDTIPQSLKRIELVVEASGHTFRQLFPAEPNLSYTYVDNNIDVYGREVGGVHYATVKIGYVYDGVYQKTERFGYTGKGYMIDGDTSRNELTLWSQWKKLIGGVETRYSDGLGA